MGITTTRNLQLGKKCFLYDYPIKNKNNAFRYTIELIDTDFLVVGAGLSGAVIAEEIAKNLKMMVIVIDRRDHIAGNLFDYADSSGIIVHKYGPHAFHTNSRQVWKFLSQFTDWHVYFHKVKALVDGIEIPVPFNINSIEKLFPKNMSDNIVKKLIDKFGYGKKIPILELRNDPDNEISFLADYVYNKVFLGYTVKQWGGPFLLS